MDDQDQKYKMISLEESTVFPVCRLCAEDNTNGEMLFSSSGGEEPDLSSMINRYLPLKVYDDGILPKTICPGCNIQLEATIQFFELLIDGQRKLRQMFKYQIEQPKKANPTQNLESVNESLKLDQHSDNNSGESSSQLFVKIMPDGSMYGPEHEVSLQMKGLDKPRKKRGRPPKVHSEEQPKASEVVQEEVIHHEEEENQDEEMEEAFENGRQRRRRKAPKRFSEAVQGKELDRIFQEEGVLDDDEERDFEHEIEEIEEELNPEPLSDPNDEVIGHLESEEGRDLGELVVVNRGRGRGRPKINHKTMKFMCNICGRGFLQRSLYIIHKSLHDSEKFECTACNKQFAGEDSLLLHQQTTGHVIGTVDNHSEDLQAAVQPMNEGVDEKIVSNVPVADERGETVDETPLQTIKENVEEIVSDVRDELPDLPAQLPEDLGIRLGPVPTNIISDVAWKKNTNVFECSICYTNNTTKEELDKHMEENHNNYCCTFCDKKFSYKIALNSHLTKHNAEKTEKKCTCKTCGKTFNHPSSLIYHRKAEHNGGKKYVCKKCGKNFKHKQLLQRHQMVHSEERPYVCDECNSTFKTKANLINHKYTHTGLKKYICDICNQQFAHKTSLTLHYRWHSGQKPFKCNVCNKSFSQNGNLQEHMRIHTGEKPYACEHCERRFTTSSQYKLHVKRHTGERPWQCEYCSKSFLHKDTWKCHVRRHKGERPFQCVYCSRNFTEQWALKKHIRLHTGEKPYTCDICGKKFADCSNLAKHKKIHKDPKVITISNLKSANGDLWQIIPAIPEGDANSQGDNVTQMFSAEEGSDDGSSQIMYISYPDPDDPNNSKTLQFGMIDKETSNSTAVPSLQLLNSNGNLLEKHSGVNDQIGMDLSDPNVQLQVTDEDGNIIPLTFEEARQLLSEGQFVSQLSDGQLIRVQSSMLPESSEDGLKPSQTINSESSADNHSAESLAASDTILPDEESPGTPEDDQAFEFETPDGQKVRLVPSYHVDSLDLTSEYLTIV